jgi:hypothetical protein
VITEAPCPVLTVSFKTAPGKAAMAAGEIDEITGGIIREHREQPGQAAAGC